MVDRLPQSRVYMEQNNSISIGNSHIPLDIVFDILTRVPTRSLFQFKCVSKSFCSLISEPSFMKSHHSKGTGLDHLLVNLPFSTSETFILDQKRTENNQLGFSSFQYLNEPCFSKFLYLECVNGLVCLWNDRDDVAICNPFTEEHVFLPNPTEIFKRRLSCCSFGFDPTTKKHKVLLAHRDSDGIRYWIFTLGMDKSWREIQCCLRFFPVMFNCVCINGVIYCVNLIDFRGLPDDGTCEHIVAFGVGEECFKMISFPRGVSLYLVLGSPTMVEIKGEVALLDHKNLRRDGKIIMYVLDGSEIDPTWVKKQTIELPPEFNNITDTFFHIRLTSTPKGEIVLIPSFRINLGYMEYKYRFLFLYDTGKKEWIKFELSGIGERNFKELRDSVWRNLEESVWSLK